jgi:hypothetical protein
MHDVGGGSFQRKPGDESWRIDCRSGAGRVPRPCPRVASPDRVGRETRGAVDVPIGDRDCTPRYGEIRVAASVLDADENDCLVAELARTGIEDGVSGIGPIAGGESRVRSDGVERDLGKRWSSWTVEASCVLPLVDWQASYESVTPDS